MIYSHTMIKKDNVRKSISKRLREENKSSVEFEILVNRLTLEELIWLKLELSAKSFVKNKFYGFPLWQTIPKITKEALISFALDAASSKRDAARFLGINEDYINKLIMQYNIAED